MEGGTIIALVVGIAIGCIIMSIVQFRERNRQYVGDIRMTRPIPMVPTRSWNRSSRWTLS